MSKQSDQSPAAGDDAAAGRSSSAWFVAVPAATFLLGGLLGGLVVGVGNDSSGSGSGSGTAGSSPGASATTPGSSTAVVVPDSCLEAADTVQEAVGLIRGGVQAIQEFRVDPILTLLDDLEDLDSRAREQAATCSGTRVTDGGEPGAAGDGSGETTESPAPSPTPEG